MTTKPDFALRHRVQFSETDAAGVVHFSNYFRWMEEVEHAWFRARGLSVAMTHDGVEIGWPRVSATCEYLLPARFEDEVELQLRVVKVGSKSFNFEVTFAVNGQDIAVGKISSVCCTIGNGKMKAIPIPPELRAKLEHPAAVPRTTGEG